MHHHSTKQRLAALRRRLGIQLTPRGGAAGKRDAATMLEAAHEEAAAAMRAAREASRRIVEALTPAPGLPTTPAAIRGLVAALTPAPSPILATADGPDDASEAPTRVAPAPYPSRHLAPPGPAPETDAGPSSRDARSIPGRLGWLALALLVGSVVVGRLLFFGASKPSAQGTGAAVVEAAPPAVQPAAEPPGPPPPAPSAAPAPRRITVSRGDCLWRLSAAHLGDPEDWRRLYELNRARIGDPDVIYPGQVLELP